MLCESGAVVVVDLVAVAMAFLNLFRTVKRVSFGILVQHAGAGAKTQGTANVFYTILVRHQGDDRIGGVGIEFDAVGIFQVRHVTGILHDGKLLVASCMPRHRPRNGI